MKKIINSIELATKCLEPRENNLVRDYQDTNVSYKVIKIIQSYYNIVNIRTWKK